MFAVYLPVYHLRKQLVFLLISYLNIILVLKNTKAELKQLFAYATSSPLFSFQGIFYDWIDGVAMGFSLGHVLANFVWVTINLCGCIDFENVK